MLNAGARYNRVAKDVVEEAWTGCNSYKENTLARSANKEEHIFLLENIFASYCSHGLLINPKKTKLFQSSISLASTSWRRACCQQRTGKRR